MFNQTISIISATQFTLKFQNIVLTADINLLNFQRIPIITSKFKTSSSKM